MASDSEANCEFLRFLCRLLVFGRWRLFSCCEGDRLHFNLFLFAILCCCRRKTNDRTKGRTNGNIASGQQKMASHIAARFLSFLLSFFFLAPSLSLFSPSWKRLASRALSKLRCERFTWLSVCPMIALSFTALLHFEQGPDSDAKMSFFKIFFEIFFKNFFETFFAIL